MFAAVAAIALLMPLLLAAVVVWLTANTQSRYYYRNYTALVGCGLMTAAFIYYLLAQIFSGEIYLKPWWANVAVFVSREDEPGRFAFLSVMLLLLCSVLIISLVRMHRIIRVSQRNL